MMRSMFSAVSGLSAHQAKMDVIGNNIANVNTVGYKMGRVTFAEAFNQTIKGASAAQDGRGGQNPMQIGLGTNLGSIETIHTKGAVERTDIPTDLMINGEGFFIVSDGTEQYTRAGNFGTDDWGNLLTQQGFRVMGYMVDESTIGSEEVVYENQLSGLTIDKSTVYPAKSTGVKITTPATDPKVGVTFEGNLDAKTPDATTDFDTATYPVNILDIEPQDSVARDTTYTVYDEYGGEHKVRIAFIKTAPNTFGVAVVDKDGNINEKPSALAFNADTKKPDPNTFKDIQVLSAAGNTTDPLPNGASPFVFRMDLSELTQYDNGSDASATNVEGYKSGTLDGFEIGADGVITASFSNNQKSAIGRIGMVKFKNPAGLMKTQGNLFTVTPNSGNPIYGKPADSGFADLTPGSLEMSNVDLSREFTTMITTQRGFQANSRIITVTDEMLQELANLKR